MTNTDRHNWDIPTVGGSNDQWGQILNDLIDGPIENHTWITVSKTGDYTAENYENVLGDASAGGITITLPAPSEDLQVNIKKVDSSSNAVTIETPNAETIDGDSNISITGQYINRTITSDGSDYYIL